MSQEASRAAAPLHAPDASASSNSSTPVVVTPPLEPSDTLFANGSAQHQRRPSPLRVGTDSRSGSRPSSRHDDAAHDTPRLEHGRDSELEGLVGEEEEDDEEDMTERPAYHRPMDGKSNTPLLKDERGRPSSYDSSIGSTRPPFHARRSTFRSRSPDMEAENATKKKYTYAAFFLGLSLVSFVVQTETAVYIQQKLGWNKPYCML
jgi:hypothetical protein